MSNSGEIHLSAVSIADPVATVARGDTVRIHSEYHAPEPTDGVMGIMIGYIDQ